MLKRKHKSAKPNFDKNYADASEDHERVGGRKKRRLLQGEAFFCFDAPY
jgi:hypothetical protein